MYLDPRDSNTHFLEARRCCKDHESNKEYEDDEIEWEDSLDEECKSIEWIEYFNSRHQIADRFTKGVHGSQNTNENLCYYLAE